MNNSTALLIFILLLIAFILVSLSPLYFAYNINQKTRAWRLLATSNQMAFVSDKFSGEARVLGQYRGHFFRLETFNDVTKNNNLYTRIVLSAGPESSQYLLKNGSFDKKHLDIKDTVSLFTAISSKYALKGQLRVEAKGQMISYQQHGIEGDVAYLQSVFELLSAIADSYSAIVAIGGGAAPYLQTIATDANHILHSVTIQLLHDIAQETKIQLKDKPVLANLLCPACLARYATNKILTPGWNSITYYGCHVCGQNQKFIEWEGQIIAILNSNIADEKSWKDKTLCVNWLVRRALFDFDKVEIVQATDEDVERFAMQVGNDTDSSRKKHYKQIQCKIASDCELSENTMRILQKTFGQVCL